MKDNGWMICSMVMVRNNGPMALYTKESTSQERSTAAGSTAGTMVLGTMVNGRRIKSKDSELTHG